MRRGTTPTHLFQIPFNVISLLKIRVWYSQNDVLLVTKTEKDAEMQGDDIFKVTLTQEETLKFDHTEDVQIQLKVKTDKGEVMASPVIRKSVDEILDDEVL